MNRHSIAAGAIIALLLISTNLPSNIVCAADRVSTLRKQQQTLQKQNRELNTRLSGLRSDITKSRTYRNSINAQLSTLQAQIDLENEKIEIIDEQIRERQSSISQMEKDIENRMNQLKNRLCTIYKSGDVAFIDILLGSNGFDDLIDKADTLKKLSSHDSKLIASIKESISKIEAEKIEIEKNREEVANAKAFLDQKKEELLELQNESNRVLSGLNGQANVLYSSMNRNSSQMRSISAQIDAICAPQNTSYDVSSYTKGNYAWPVPSSRRITSYWGDGRGHKGIDIGAPRGTPIIAADDGVVVKAVTSGWGGGYGLHVQINHGSGCETVYGHCSSLCVGCGQHVSKGQVIAYVGSTGQSTGPHLHFETRKNGVKYNPMSELR